jgi:conjugative transfer region protein (TIGR03750 family)
VSEEITFIPDRLNEEPVVFLSMTHSELKLAIVACLLFWTPVCLIVAMLAERTVLGLAGIMAMSYASMWLFGKKLRVIKRGRPKQYHVMAITAWLEDKQLKRRSMTRVSQVWDIHRHRRFAG